MKRWIAVFASIFAVLAMSSQSADAFFRHRKIDKRVHVVGIGAGVGSTVAYWSALDWRWSGHSDAYRWGAWGATTAGCAVIAPIIAGAMVPERELTKREAGSLIAGCILPIVGSLIVNAAYDANPQWEADEKAVMQKAARHKKRMRK